MNQGRSWFKAIVLLSLVLLVSLSAGCSSDNGRSTNETLRIYEMAVAKGSFAAVAGDTTATRFQLNLNEVPEQILYFTNRGATESGYDSTDNVMNKIWPRVYGAVAPNAVMQATTADQGTINLFCMLDKPVYNKGTGQLGFTITYLNGRRPAANLALTDVKIIIANNAASAQPGVWSQLMAGDSGALTPTKDPGIYTFSMQKAIGGVYEFTCAPQRKSSNLTAKKYIESWQTRFGTDPPNATIAYNAKDNSVGGVQVVTLTNPVYNETTGGVSFTAKLLYGTAPIGAGGLALKNPSLFIDGNNGDDFPTYADNVFSIQYRNSTPDSIAIWLTGDQPPCSKAEAKNCDTTLKKTNDDPKNPDKTQSDSEYTANWKAVADSGAFERSKTYFYIISAAGTQKKIAVTNKIILAKGETLRIVPPVNDKGLPEWFWHRAGKDESAGVATWVTKSDINMPSIYAVSKLEFNLNAYDPAHDKGTLTHWIDMSAVDGLNTNVSFMYEGDGCGKDDPNCGCNKDGVPIVLPRACTIDLDLYKPLPGNDGCPYIMTTDQGAKTCPNPKFYPESGEINSDSLLPAWVVAQDKFTTNDVETSYKSIWTGAGSPSGKVMADAGEGAANKKKAYHVWWSTNPVGQGWINYLQNNWNGTCDQYAWAYDELRWYTTDGADSFNSDGNPPKINPHKPLFTCPVKSNTYMNFDIKKVM